MKTHVFIDLQRFGKSLLERRGPWLGLPHVEISDSETCGVAETSVNAVIRWLDQFITYDRKLKPHNFSHEFKFDGEPIQAVFVTVTCMHAFPRKGVQLGSKSFEYLRSAANTDEIYKFYLDQVDGNTPSKADNGSSDVSLPLTCPA